VRFLSLALDSHIYQPLLRASPFLADRPTVSLVLPHLSSSSFTRTTPHVSFWPLNIRCTQAARPPISLSLSHTHIHEASFPYTHAWHTRFEGTFSDSSSLASFSYYSRVLAYIPYRPRSYFLLGFTLYLYPPPHTKRLNVLILSALLQLPRLPSQSPKYRNSKNFILKASASEKLRKRK
jgi:hypothetical protein